jgi:hypothetical protein
MDSHGGNLYTQVARSAQERREKVLTALGVNARS